MQPPPLLYELDEVEGIFARATATYHQDLTQYLSFAEWRTTTTQ